MMKYAISSLLFFSCVSTFAQDAAKGAELYKQCIACHGAKGEGNVAQKAPKLSGQYDWYVEKQILDIREGKLRKNEVMIPFVSKLSAQDVKDLAAYISQL